MGIIPRSLISNGMADEQAYVLAFMQGLQAMYAAQEEEKLRQHGPDEHAFLLHFIRDDLGLRGPVDLGFLSAVQMAMISGQRNNPSTPQIIGAFMTTRCPCRGLHDGYPVFEACVHIMDDLKHVPSCELIEHTIMYHAFERRFPTLDELVVMRGDIQSIEQDPEAYCTEKRLLVRTENLGKLVAVKSVDSEQQCSICQECISEGEGLFRLPCGHCFHAERCMESGKTIVDWLKTCKKCPNCNQEVIL